MSSICGGIDFGTSNSSVGYMRDDVATLIEFGEQGASVPSAIFYSSESPETAYGKHAVARYRSGTEGRLLRSLKSVLGSSLMNEKTTIRNKRVPFTEIIQDFFLFLHATLESTAGNAATSVVVGRPVHFVDDDEQRDRAAEQQLREIAEAVGFAHVEFQFEPIAAALNYEASLSDEQLALVVDIGGGTADFTLIRLSPDLHQRSDRSQDILATTGVHIGGTDFDRLLSLQSLMPLLGMGSGVKGTNRELPKSVYFDLATWHRIPLLYNNATLLHIREMLLDAAEPKKVERLLDVVSGHHGHELAAAMEQVKISLSEHASARFSLAEISADLSGQVDRLSFESAIQGAMHRLLECVTLSLTDAGVASKAITSVFYTGGSSSIPLLQRSVAEIFPEARHVLGDRFGSVGLGLTIDAGRRFA